MFIAGSLHRSQAIFQRDVIDRKRRKLLRYAAVVSHTLECRMLRGAVSLHVERTLTSPSSVGAIECRMLRGAVSLHVERTPTSPSSVGTIECRMLRCAVTQHVDLPMRYAAVVSHTTLSGGGVE